MWVQGRRCDGYSSQNAKDTQIKAQTARSSSSRPSYSTGAPSITTYAIPFRIPGSQRERQMLHYFCVEAAADLTGFSYSDFWERTVLQSSYDEPVVRQALIALSSAHLEYGRKAQNIGEGTDDLDVDPEPLIQYNKAIRKLRRYMTSKDQPSIHVTFTCCALFFCFENTRGHYDNALQHLRNGVMILREARATPTASTSAYGSSLGDIDELAHVLARMDLQATLFDDSRTPLLDLTTPEERAGTTPCIPRNIFFNLGEAQKTLDKLQNQLLRFLTLNNDFKFTQQDQLPAFIVQEKMELEEQYYRWSIAMEGFMRQKQGDASEGMQLSQKKRFREGAMLLRLHHATMQMLLLANFPENNDIWGASPNLYAENILHLSEALISNTKVCSSPAATDAVRSFSSEMGVVVPLSMLAVKCRDVQICSRAVSLLAASKRREGLVDAQMVVKLVQGIAVLKAQQTVTPLVAEAAERMGNTLDTMALEGWGAEVIDSSKGGLHNLAKMLEVD
ncbi:MAG: hypothetical protein M1818_005020 [Claussenomyces sp. TS43310]|nr:MAG: hypothetical protein M1818_005020 [Claussenomyces sp. TS43310]